MDDQLIKWSKTVYLVYAKSETDKQKLEKYFEFVFFCFFFDFMKHLCNASKFFVCTKCFSVKNAPRY